MSEQKPKAATVEGNGLANEVDVEEDFGWDDISQMTPDQIQIELIEQRKRFESMERDLFKSHTAARKLTAQVKSLQELNSMHRVTKNDTSSAFTLPSEFKKLWDELVTELILDAFPDFLDQYKLFVCLVQELFIVVHQLILDTKRDIVIKMAIQLRLLAEDADLNSSEAKQVTEMLQTKLQSVFKDYSTQIFEYKTDQIKKFIDAEYRPRCELILTGDDDAIEMFEDNVGTPDFIRFVKAIVKLQLHMVLNDPPIQLSMLSCKERDAKTELIEKYEFWMFNKNDYYCIDGFPREGYPCVVVLPPPYRQGYVYQGIKPAVIVLSDDNQDDMLMEHVHTKQQAVLEKLKQKRANSLATVKEITPQQEETKSKQLEPSGMMINIKKIEVPQKDSNLSMSASKKNKNNDVINLEPEQEETATTGQVFVDDQNQKKEIFKKAIETVIEDAPSGTPSSQTTSVTQKNIKALEGSEKRDEIILDDQQPETMKETNLDPSKIDQHFENNKDNEINQSQQYNDDDETEIRESGPLESNDPQKTTGKIETAFLDNTIKPEILISETEMIELPIEVIKSSHTKVVEVNLPPRGTINSARRKNSRKDLSSPSPHFQSRKMDRKIGESEEEEQSAITPQHTTAEQQNHHQNFKELAPAPPSSQSRKSLQLSELTDRDGVNHSIEIKSIEDCEEEGSYTKRLIETEKSRITDSMMDFSDSRNFTIESQEGGVQEIQGSLDQSEIQVNFQLQMKNLAETVKGSMALTKEGGAKPIAIDSSDINNSIIQQHHNQQQVIYQQSHLTDSLDENIENGSIVASQQRNYNEMPMKVHESSNQYQNDRIEENVNSSAKKKQQKMFFSQNMNNSPYFQSSKFSMQAAKNQVNSSSIQMISNNNATNVFKRDRSSSNNAKRPPMPTSASLVSYNNQTCPTTNSPHHHGTLSMGEQQQQAQSRMSHGIQMTNQQHSQGSGSSTMQQQQLSAQQFQQSMSHLNLQQQYQQNFQAVSLSEVSVLPISNGNASVIAEMHYQKGMTVKKQDLQREIVKYQQFLKKNYAQAEKEKQAKKRNEAGKQYSKDNTNPREKTPNQSIHNKRKAGIPSAAALEQRCQPSKVVSSNAAISRGESKKRNTSKDKESLDQLKVQLAKMQSRVVNGTSNQAQNRREDSQSRSKSPMQPWKNMPRQMPSSMKDAYVPTTAIIPINRKSISRGKSGSNKNPSIGNKQVSIKQGLKTTMTANSGQYFPNTGIPGRNSVTNKNNKAYAKKRNSIYADSDSSDDIVRGSDMRRGSAPMMHEKATVEIERSSQQTVGHRKRQQQVNKNTYVLTSDSDDSDSDSDDSISENQRVDVYQPASHLRKAINGQHTSKPAPSTTKNTARHQVTSGVAASRQSHSRIKSTGIRETSQTNNKRTHRKGSSNTRAKHGIQSVQNRTAITGIIDKKGLKQATSTTSAKGANQTHIHNGYQGINFFNTGGTDEQISLIQNGNSSQTYGSSSSQAKLTNQNRTVQQISTKSISGHHGTKVAPKREQGRQLVQGGFVSPKQEYSRVSSSNHGQVHHHNTIDHNIVYHQPPQGQNFHPQSHNQNSLISQNQMAVGITRSSSNLINKQQMIPSQVKHQGHNNMGNGFQPIYNLRSQAQINLLENHRLTESNFSNTSAFERVINPVNDLNPSRKGSDIAKVGGSTQTGYTEARNRAMVNNYV